MIKTKLYGFKWKELPWGERVPDCSVVIRFIMHCFWRALYHLVPTNWMLERSGRIRNYIGITTLEWFGWWAYSHRKNYGYKDFPTTPAPEM